MFSVFSLWFSARSLVDLKSTFLLVICIVLLFPILCTLNFRADHNIVEVGTRIFFSSKSLWNWHVFIFISGGNLKQAGDTRLHDKGVRLGFRCNITPRRWIYKEKFLVIFFAWWALHHIPFSIWVYSPDCITYRSYDMDSILSLFQVGLSFTLFYLKQSC